MIPWCEPLTPTYELGEPTWLVPEPFRLDRTPTNSRWHQGMALLHQHDREQAALRWAAAEGREAMSVIERAFGRGDLLP